MVQAPPPSTSSVFVFRVPAAGDDTTAADARLHVLSAVVSHSSVSCAEQCTHVGRHSYSCLVLGCSVVALAKEL
jgi:hypothetical protein